MRILVNHFSPSPNVMTGITSYTWAITNALADCPGQEIFLCTNWNRENVPSEIAQKCAGIFYAPTSRNETRAFLKRAIDVPRLEAKIGFDVIFTPSYYTVPFSRAARVTVVHDFYILDFPASFRWTRHLQWNAIFPLSARRSDMILCISAATRDDLVRHYPYTASKAAIVHEASALPASAVAAPENPIGEPYGLMVANIEPTKNVTQFFDALRLMAQSGRHHRFVLVGRDREKAIAAFREHAPDVRLTHVERATDDELATLYKHARCYINTSISEGFCLPILEAQNFGTPVICSDLPVLHEVAGDGADFVNPRDPEALKATICRLFDDDHAASALSSRGLANAQRFSWAKAAKETLGVCEEAAEKSRSKS